MSLQSYLDQAIKAVCPIHGISFGKLDDKTTWMINFDDSATAEQRSAAQVVMADFMWNETTQEIDRKAIRNEKYKNDLVMKQGYANYKLQKPDANFGDYLDYLESI
jgi:hypothetical protein